MKKNKISALAKQHGVVLGFVLLICIGALLSETFLSAQNLINILKQYAPIVVISCGTTLVIIEPVRSTSAQAPWLPCRAVFPSLHTCIRTRWLWRSLRRSASAS